MSFQQDIEAKSLSLLNYALKEKGVPNGLFHIGHQGDERQLNDKLCLLKTSDGRWTVFYTERGSISQKSDHSNLNEAMVDFFWKLTRKDTPWDYREGWERDTGLSF